MNLAKLFAVSLLFLLVMTSVSLSAVALTGELSIGAGGDYTTFTSAINALNTNGVGAGGVIFNVVSGSVFSENLPAITATGTADDQIVFRKSGTNAYPQVRPSGTAGTTDAGLIVHGGDYITFDGIDVNSSAVTTVEYPNPFNPDTTIKYSLKEVSSGSLSIYNQRGQLVRDFQITNAPAGPNSIYWNGMDSQGRYVSSGLYLFILRVGSESFNRKATIVK
ncbi:MAG: hypothetical protein CVU49_00735 [Candidatus Cloacimonetes bacterium HGW-Cloacimonetes-2]|jgi:hypothetical protein|nr:MAG: hypothetical protein CVU49_00735 [Candidatus Cloacimonetes bacterium HGW-Cloacimonetes-2]